jgi:hypothetical protein
MPVVVRGKQRAESELKKFEDSYDASDRLRAGATSLRKPILRLEQTPQKPPNVAKRNWKGENRKLSVRQRLGSCFRHTLRDERFGSHLHC